MATITTRQGDTWDILAKRIYGDEHDMKALIAANLNHRKTVIFPYGAVINVPETETEAVVISVGLPPWKRI